MKMLVLVTDYPRPKGTHSYMFVHVRNMYYVKYGVEVTVINFASKDCYEIDGIRVITEGQYRQENREYDLLVSHASNLRNHYKFLKKNEKLFRHIIFFFHGQEILKFREAYPKPYDYCGGGSTLKRVFRNRYDDLKIFLWSKYYKKLENKADFVFVSNWIKNQFVKNTKLNELKHIHIINNSVGAVFEQAEYDWKREKKYDFITIRSNMDGSKYGVDIVCKLAEENPKMSFLLIGKGRYFQFNRKPDNVKWINSTFSHEEVLEFLNQASCGLLPTREDTQGVMTCEMATLGMPVITSDIEVCHEFFDDMPNVELIQNECSADICEIRDRLIKKLPYKKCKLYFADATILRELQLFIECRKK